MVIDRIDHLAINTIDLDETVRFYQQVFGFQEHSRADMGKSTLVYLEISPGSFLELFDQHGLTEPGTVGLRQQGIRHIAFHVEDIRAWDAWLKEKQVPYEMELTRMEPIHRDGLLVRDPNGVVIELTSEY